MSKDGLKHAECVSALTAARGTNVPLYVLNVSNVINFIKEETNGCSS